MPRFAVIMELPSEETAILNLDAIATVSRSAQPDGSVALEIEMISGKVHIVDAEFDDLVIALQAHPL
jgi:hypothetical protein